MQNGSSFIDGLRRRAIARKSIILILSFFLLKNYFFSPLIIATTKISSKSAAKRFTSISYKLWLLNMYVKAKSDTNQTIPWQLHSKNLQWVLKLRTWTKFKRNETNFLVSSTSFLRSFFKGSGTIRFSPSRRVSELIFK